MWYFVSFGTDWKNEQTQHTQSIIQYVFLFELREEYIAIMVSSELRRRINRHEIYHS